MKIIAKSFLVLSLVSGSAYAQTTQAWDWTSAKPLERTEELSDGRWRMDLECIEDCHVEVSDTKGVLLAEVTLPSISPAAQASISFTAVGLVKVTIYSAASAENHVKYILNQI